MPTIPPRSITSFDAGAAAVMVAATFQHQINRARDRVEAARSMVMGQTRGSYLDDSIYVGPNVNPGALYYEGRIINRQALFQQVRWHEQWLAYGVSLNDRYADGRYGTRGADAFEQAIFRRHK